MDREKRLEYHRAYRERNRARLLEQDRLRRLARTDEDRRQINERLRVWRQEHPAEQRAISLRSELKKKQKRHDQGTSLPQDSCKCLCCGLVFRRENVVETFIYKNNYTGICGECQA